MDGNYDADGLACESKSKSCRKSLALQYFQGFRILENRMGGRYSHYCRNIANIFRSDGNIAAIMAVATFPSVFEYPEPLVIL